MAVKVTDTHKIAGELHSEVLATQARLRQSGAAPPMGGWYNTAVETVAERHGLNPYTLRDFMDAEARMEFDGLEVVIMRSAGSDGAITVQIDSCGVAPADCNPDGTPAIRVFVNEGTVYSGRDFKSGDA